MTAPAADGVTSAVEIRPTTRVLLQDRYGPPDLLRLERIARPEPAAGEVLHAVAAAHEGVGPGKHGFVQPSRYPYRRMAPTGVFYTSLSGGSAIRLSPTPQGP